MKFKNDKVVLAVASVVTLIAIIAIIVQIVQNGFVKHNVDVEGTGDKLKYSKSVVSEGAINYLKSQKELEKDLQGKKVVVYYTGKDCAFASDMKKAVVELSSKEDFANTYVFYPEAGAASKFFPNREDAVAYIEFSNVCKQFCIVKPDKKQILSIENMDGVKAKEIPQILDQFKNW